MKIIIIGCGQVGSTLAGQLSEANHDITLIDTNIDKVRKLSEAYDVMGICENGTSVRALDEAGVREADILIAVTESDEINLLCALMAKKLSTCHTIARVRNPLYNSEREFLRKQLGISMIINPDLATAAELASLIRYPSAQSIESFAGGLVHIVKIKLLADNPLCNTNIRDIGTKTGRDMLVCAVERKEDVLIPSGDTRLECGDTISFIADERKLPEIFTKLGFKTRHIKNVMIVGGKRIGYYTADILSKLGLNIKIIEENKDRCEELDELLPDVTVVWGDGTDKDLLISESIASADAFIATTGIDEENIFLTMFAKEMADPKCVSKVDKTAFDNIIENLDIDSVVYPNFITADYIMQYVRKVQNSAGNNVEALYRLLANKVEAIEFNVCEKSPLIDIPLRELDLEKDLLVCSIFRDGKTIIPGGNDCIKLGDQVIIVTLHSGLSDISDILRD